MTDAEVAVTKDGKLLGLRVKTTANLGAYLSTFAPAVPTYLYATLLNGVYEWPAIHARSPASSPTPRRWTPTAGPAGPRPATCSSG